MTTYKEIHGTKIEAVASDPSNPVEGQVWYNTTSNVLKGSIRTAAGSWATSGNLNTGRFYVAGAGTQTSGIAVGGERNPGGIQTNVELYDGSARWGAGTAGTETSGLVFGRAPPQGAETETWNGSSWTEVADLNTGRYVLGGGGTQTSALGFGGTPGGVALTESWNGSAWTEVADLNTAREFVGGTGTSNTAALAFGGAPQTGVTETWNGSAWTETSDLNNGRGGGANSGNETSALLAGGQGTNQLDSAFWPRTEEFTGAGSTLTRTFTDS